MPIEDSRRRSRWYFGGLAAAAAVCFTHPIDLIKVLLQTQQEKVSMSTTISNLYREHGVIGFYNGLSASVVRQLTYSITRFGMYEVGKSYINTNTLLGKIYLAAIAGMFGGLVGVPADVVNVRMQNDVKLPAEQRRNYKHVLDGLIKINNQEGMKKLFSGATMATSRGVLMTVGQLASYDHIKEMLLNSGYFDDTLPTHFSTSILAGGIATTLTQPLDVLKTRAMNAKPGEFKNLLEIIKHTGSSGPMGFYKGYVPAFLRIAPQTVILFLLLEQLRINFGILDDS